MKDYCIYSNIFAVSDIDHIDRLNWWMNARGLRELAVQFTVKLEERCEKVLIGRVL